MPRLAVIVAALLLLAFGAWYVGTRQDETRPDTGATTTTSANGGASPADAALGGPVATGDAAAGPERRDAGARPTPGPMFTVTGIVLADRRSPDLSAVRVRAWCGEPGDRGGIVPMNMGSGSGSTPSFVLTGEPVADAAV